MYVRSHTAKYPGHDAIDVSIFGTGHRDRCMYVPCVLERESAGSHSGAVLLCTYWQPSNCRATVHACYIAGHHILLIFEANY